MTPSIDTSEEPIASPPAGGGQGGNLVTLKDGSRHFFPAGTTVDQMNKALKLSPQKPQENLVDKIRPFIAGGAGAGAAALTSLIPGVGESGVAEVAADTQTYALVDSLLKYLGANPPKSYSEALTGSEADAAVNAVAGKLINGVFRGAKSIFGIGTPDFYKFAPTASQALEKFGMNKLATVSRFIEDYGVPSAKAEALDRSGGEGFTQALAHANAINGRMAGTNSNPQKLYDAIKGQLQLGIDEIPGTGTNFPLHKASQEALDMLTGGDTRFKVLDKVIADPDQLSKVLKVGQITGSPAMNVKNDLAAYKFMDMVNKATTEDLKGGVRIDPNLLGKMWTDEKMQSSLKLLYGEQGMQRISDFFKDIAYTQTSGATNPQMGKYLKYIGAGKFLMNTGAIAHAVTTGNYVPAAGLAGIQLSSWMVGKMLTNPTTARIITDMAEGTFKPSPWHAKIIGNAVRNMTVGLVGGDGSIGNGSFEENPNTGMLEFQPHK